MYLINENIDKMFKNGIWSLKIFLQWYRMGWWRESYLWSLLPNRLRSFGLESFDLVVFDLYHSLVALDHFFEEHILLFEFLVPVLLLGMFALENLKLFCPFYFLLHVDQFLSHKVQLIVLRLEKFFLQLLLLQKVLVLDIN